MIGNGKWLSEGNVKERASLIDLPLGETRCSATATMELMNSLWAAQVMTFDKEIKQNQLYKQWHRYGYLYHCFWDKHFQNMIIFVFLLSSLLLLFLLLFHCRLDQIAFHCFMSLAIQSSPVITNIQKHNCLFFLLF